MLRYLAQREFNINGEATNRFQHHDEAFKVMFGTFVRRKILLINYITILSLTF